MFSWVVSSLAILAFVIVSITAFFAKISLSRRLLFIIMSGFLCAFVLLFQISSVSYTPSLDLLLNQSVYYTIAGSSLFVFFLVRSLSSKSFTRSDALIIIIYLVASILFFSNLFIPSLTYLENGIYILERGVLYVPLVVLLLLPGVSALYLIVSELRLSKGYRKTRFLILAVSLFIVIGGMTLTNIVIPNLLSLHTMSSLAPLWVFVWALSLYYATIRYQFLGVNYTGSKALFAIASSFVSLVWILSVGYIFFENRSSSPVFERYLTTFILVAVTTPLVRYIYSFLYQTINNTFGLGDRKENIIEQFKVSIGETLDIETIYRMVDDFLHRFFGAPSNMIILLNDGTSITYPKDGEVEETCRWLSSKWDLFFSRDVVSLEVLLGATEFYPISESDIQKIKDLNNAGYSLVVRLKDARSFILLHDVNRLYSEFELNNLNKMAGDISLSLSRALLHKEVQTFSITLQKKVDTATRQLKERNKELQDLYDNLEELYQKEKDLMDIAGHEFRTPASILKNNLYLLKKRIQELLPDQSDEKINKYVQRLIEGTERQIKLVNTFLESARIDNKRFELEVEMTDLAAIVTQAVSELKHFAKEKDLELIYRQPKGKVFAEVDVIRIREVIDNLINNAIKYTKQGYIEIQLSETKEKVTFSVKDTGIGIKKEDQALLFKKFSRVENYIGGEEGSIVRPGGTGLGLYVAKTIVDAHSGTIGVESNVGQGSLFFFELPHTQPSYMKRANGPRTKIVMSPLSSSGIGATTGQKLPEGSKVTSALSDVTTVSIGKSSDTSTGQPTNSPATTLSTSASGKTPEITETQSVSMPQPTGGQSA